MSSRDRPLFPSCSANESIVPPAPLMLFWRLLTSSGAVLISASHGAIWFLPKIALAAAICSASDKSLNLSCNSFWTVAESFMFPSASVMEKPNLSIISAPCFAGETSLARPVFRLLAALSASIPLLAITPMYRAASLTLYPALEKIGAATLMAFDKLSTFNAELLQAAAKTSA